MKSRFADVETVMAQAPKSAAANTPIRIFKIRPRSSSTCHVTFRSGAICNNR
jgi:ribosomal protein L5